MKVFGAPGMEIHDPNLELLNRKDLEIGSGTESGLEEREKRMHINKS